MDFESIMQEIKRGLTGDKAVDKAYLLEQAKKYNDNEYHAEIARECGRMVFEMASPEYKQSFSNAMREDIRNTFLSKYAKAGELKQSGKYEEALAVVEPLLKSMPEQLGADDSVSEYRLFREEFEEILYREQCKPQKTIKTLTMPLSEGYTIYGSLLIDLERPAEARAALEKAMHWEPRSTALAFEHAETYKIEGNMDKYLECIKDIFKFSFRSQHLARCYRGFGYYFTEKEMWDVAVSCLVMSLKYEQDSKYVGHELAYIENRTGKSIDAPSMDTIIKLLKDNGIPTVANEDVTYMACEYGMRYFKKGDKQHARYFFEIAYDMSRLPDIKFMLELAVNEGAARLKQYFMLPQEFTTVDGRPTDPKNCKSYAMENENTVALLQIYPIEQDQLMPFLKPQAVIDGIRKTLDKNQALIEVDNLIADDDNAIIYSIVKTLHEKPVTGVQYYMLAHLIVDGYIFAVRGFFDEQDKQFPEHPLTICRNVVECLKKKVLSKAKETEGDLASDTKKSPLDLSTLPKIPAERPKGKTVIECGVECINPERKNPHQIRTMLYSDGRLYKAYYVDSKESIVNGIRKPVHFELIGTLPAAADEMKSMLKGQYSEYMTWPDFITCYNDGANHEYHYSLKVPSKSFSGEDMFKSAPYGPKVKELFDVVAKVMQKYFPDVDIMENLN